LLITYQLAVLLLAIASNCLRTILVFLVDNTRIRIIYFLIKLHRIYVSIAKIGEPGKKTNNEDLMGVRAPKPYEVT
jgi:hypothetical protein